MATPTATSSAIANETEIAVEIPETAANKIQHLSSTSTSTANASTATLVAPTLGNQLPMLLAGTDLDAANDNPDVNVDSNSQSMHMHESESLSQSSALWRNSLQTDQREHTEQETRRNERRRGSLVQLLQRLGDLRPLTLGVGAPADHDDGVIVELPSVSTDQVPPPTPNVPQPQPRQNTLAQSPQEAEERYLWAAWRVWLVVHGMYIVAMLIASGVIYAEVGGSTCNRGTFRWLCGYWCVATVQLIVGGLLLWRLPSVYDSIGVMREKSRSALLLYGGSRVFSAVYMAWIAVGVVTLTVSPRAMGDGPESDLATCLERRLETEGSSRDPLFELAYYLIMGQAVVLLLYACPFTCLPCGLLLATCADDQDEDFAATLPFYHINQERHGAPLEIVRALPVESVSVVGEREPVFSCAICLSDAEDTIDPGSGPTLVKRLPCQHRFHITCIDDWLVRNALW